LIGKGHYPHYNNQAMSKYLWLLLFSGVVPFILSFWPDLRFYRKPSALLCSIGLIALVFGGWDVFATWRGHWFFDPQGVGSLRIINLPVEEALFFVVIPFCCIFTWEVLKYLKAKMR